MINFYSEINFELQKKNKISQWIKNTITLEGFKEGEINYIFCDDTYLHKLNVEFLNHDTLTDIISFDYSVGNEVHGDIFISIDRVKENAQELSNPFLNELYRVIIHGILHYCGYNDKNSKERAEMRDKEDFYLKTIL